jgi:hypothetical protein
VLSALVRIKVFQRSPHAVLPASRMSPYVVPDRGAERCLQTISTPTSAAPIVVSFDSLDSLQANLILEDDVPVQPPDPSEEGLTNTNAPSLSIPVWRPYMQHKHFFFDDGNITFLVRPLRLTSSR